MTCSATAACSPKCRRCYRLRWDAANKERNAELRRARHRRTRERGLAQRRQYYLAHREEALEYARRQRELQARAKMLPTDTLIRVPVKGWGVRV